ncbi:sulfonate transport system substrate-binding protein [Kineosphaera limosa]|uniref:ABC transporter substrate-binding protein n=1 Tax=Kineosphaera limosa TaxID=111564 RepID=UPI0002FE08B3|nr:ABC transporter substrate-binding protein [Kineosphaera limosa]NYE00717.1 sulfonate transport system substrate-binding protein [Kineosphaera limosa]
MSALTGRRVSLIGVALAAAAATVLGACAPSTGGGSAPVAATVPATVSADQLTATTLKVGDQKAGLKALLQAAGQDETAYDIQWSTFTSGPPLLEAAAAGAIDVGGVGNTPPIFAGAAGSPIAAVSASRDDARGDAILVAKGSTATSLPDLKGRRVAVAKGSSAHGHLVLQLRKAGLTTSDVQIAFVAPSDGYAALAAGRVDAWAVWDPYTAQAEQELGARILVDGHGVANGLSFQVASRAALADGAKNTAIEDLVQRTARARLWAKAHPQEWAKVYADETGLPYEVSLASAKRSDDEPITISDEVVAAEQALVDALASEKVIPTAFTFADYVDRRFEAPLEAVIKAGATNAPVTTDSHTTDSHTTNSDTTGSQEG